MPTPVKLQFFRADTWRGISARSATLGNYHEFKKAYFMLFCKTQHKSNFLGWQNYQLGWKDDKTSYHLCSKSSMAWACLISVIYLFVCLSSFYKDWASTKNIQLQFVLFNKFKRRRVEETLLWKGALAEKFASLVTSL